MNKTVKLLKPVSKHQFKLGVHELCNMHFKMLFLFKVDIGSNDAADANVLVSLTDGWTDQEKNVLRFVCKFDIVTIIL